MTEARLAWQDDLAAAGQLTPEIVEDILAVHGDRGGRAIDAVTEGRIKAYRDFTVVVGHEDEYIVEGRACTCHDATFNLDTSDPTQRCWHALAVIIAKAIGRVDEHDMWYSDVRDFL